MPNNVVQKGDLAFAGFSNNNTANSGGIDVRVDVGSTVGNAIAAAIAAAAGAGGPALTNAYPSTSTTTAATPAFVNAAIADAGSVPATTTAPGIVKLTDAAPVAPADNSTTAATPAFVAAAIAAAGAGGGTVHPATTSVAGIVRLATEQEAIDATQPGNVPANPDAVVTVGVLAAMLRLAGQSNRNAFTAF